MVTRRAGAVAFLLLGVLVVAALAGSYGTAVPGEPGAGDGTGTGDSPPETVDEESGPGGSLFAPSGWVIETIVQWMLGLGVLVSVLGAIAAVWFGGLDGLKRVYVLLRDTLGGTVLYVVVVGILVWLAFGFTGEGIEIPSQSADEPSGGGSGGTGDDVDAADGGLPPWALPVTVAVLLAVGVALLVRTRLKRTVAVGTDIGDGGNEAVPSAIGPDGSAEPIEDVPPSNSVFRAWRRMADRVDEASDRTLTTGEVARVAIERGMDRDAVGTLTGLFEEVRYGDRPATTERERRAESALAAVEREAEESR